MNRIFSFLLFVFAVVALPTVAQNAAVEQANVASAARYGRISRAAILAQLPELKMARTQLDSLRAKYEREARYNEESFRRQFSEYLQIQRNLPEAILLKRQGDLQTAMERGLAFRKQAEELLRKAELELMQPIEDKVDAAIRVVGAEHKYDFIFDEDVKALPYLNPALCEDATAFVKEKLDVRR